MYFANSSPAYAFLPPSCLSFRLDVARYAFAETISNLSDMNA